MNMIAAGKTSSPTKESQNASRKLRQESGQTSPRPSAPLLAAGGQLYRGVWQLDDVAGYSACGARACLG
jgi:hypothetical protein